MNITTIGIDLAKNVFQVHGTDERGKAVLTKVLRRAQMVQFFAQRPPCLIGIEACGSAHFWARKLTALGHTVKLMAPQFVKPYVKSNKNDARDAEAICEAVGRPSMRFVAIKTPEQQALLAVHRARQGWVRARTAQGNQIRGLLAELGCVMRKGRRHLDEQVQALEAQIKAWHREDAASRRLEAVPGIGPLTASALVASIGDARNFKNGRQLSAWLGLVPRQHSSGGKPTLLGISKRGDVYLRTLLIHGARSALQRQSREHWGAALAERRNKNLAAVALANKNARIVWALLAHGRDFRADYRGVRSQAA